MRACCLERPNWSPSTQYFLMRKNKQIKIIKSNVEKSVTKKCNSQRKDFIPMSKIIAPVQHFLTCGWWYAHPFLVWLETKLKQSKIPALRVLANWTFQFLYFVLGSFRSLPLSFLCHIGFVSRCDNYCSVVCLLFSFFSCLFSRQFLHQFAFGFSCVLNSLCASSFPFRCARRNWLWSFGCSSANHQIEIK